MKVKEPKPMHRILTEIGEHIVAYELQKRGWQVMLNLGGIGFDIFAKKGDVSRKIEVKTTDPGQKVGRYRQHLRQRITDAERNICDFVVVYVHGYNKFLVIPIREIPEHNSIVMYIGKNGNIKQYAEFENAWERLE
jgi:predicted RNA-binding protein with PUA domain